MNLIAAALSIFAIKARIFEEATKDPIAAQKKTLFEYLERNKDTEYGRGHRFSEIRSIEDYRRNVPLTDSEKMRPFLERMANGEENVLTADKPVFFGATSGTSNRPKLIPTTKFSESKKDELLDIWGYYISRDHPRLLNGKILAIVSPEIEGHTPRGIPFGAESGRGYKELPAIVKSLYSLPYRVFEIQDYDARYYTILRISMEHDVTTIASLNPGTIILLSKKIAKWCDILIEDIDKGTINNDFSIEPDIRSQIEKHLSPNPARAEVLREILREKGELLPKYFWPNLELIECWKGGSMKLYLRDLSKYVGNVPTRDMGCLSTETRSSVPISDEGAYGILAIMTNFYEFIPKEEIGNSSPRTLLCDELEKGRDYFIVVTTPGGLYRYNIDDIIRVDGFFNKTPMIEFIQKGLNAISLVGEKLYESQVGEALNRALERSKLSVWMATAYPVIGEAPHYDLLVEFCDASVSADEKRRFLEAVDEELRRENDQYLWARQAQLLYPPSLKVVKKGGFERYRISRISKGAQDGQFKAPELTGDYDFHKNFQIEETIRLDAENV